MSPHQFSAKLFDCQFSDWQERLPILAQFEMALYYDMAVQGLIDAEFCRTDWEVSRDHFIFMMQHDHS